MFSLNDMSALRQLEDSLRDKLKSQGRKGSEIQFRLAENLLQQGRLEDALTEYRKIAEVRENELVDRRIEILEGNVRLCDHGEVFPTFSWFDDFLSAEEEKVIWDEVSQRQNDFKLGRVGQAIDLERRSTQVLFEKNFPASASVIRSRILRLREEPGSVFPSGDLNVEGAQIHLTCHGDGDFLGTHRDNDGNSTESLREWTLVYYFHREPKRFSGGDLLVYDSEDEHGRSLVRYTRFSPKRNAALVFPSRFFHEVTKVEQKTGDFLDGRFSLNVWLSKKA